MSNSTEVSHEIVQNSHEIVQKFREIAEKFHVKSNLIVHQDQGDSLCCAVNGNELSCLHSLGKECKFM